MNMLVTFAIRGKNSVVCIKKERDSFDFESNYGGGKI